MKTGVLYHIDDASYNRLPTRPLPTWLGIGAWKSIESAFGADDLCTKLPVWDGSALNGKTVYVYDEQGIGDALMMVRHLCRLKSEYGAGRIIFGVRPALRRLIEANRVTLGIDAVLPYIGRAIEETGEVAGDISDDAACFVEITTSCTLLGKPRSDTPVAYPYLFAPEEDRTRWKSRMEEIAPCVGGLRVGIVWAARYEEDRCCPASAFSALAAVPGVQLISVQKGPTEADWCQIPGAVSLSGEIGDLVDTAAILANLDLVVTVDTSVAHLAGAMGKPIWILLKREADPRWMLDRTDCPMYPSAKLYRQCVPGDWETVLSRVATCLSELQVQPGPDASQYRLQTQ